MNQGVAGMDRGVRLQDIYDLNDHLANEMQVLKSIVYRPDAIKNPPVFSSTQLADLCGVGKTTLLRHLEGAGARGLSAGITEGSKASAPRSFTLEQSIAWVNAISNKAYKRKPGQSAAVITVGFFKGGVGKTVLSTSLAQGLSLKGYKVLAIDMDPQGSMSAMLGVDPAAVMPEETFAPITFPPGHVQRNENLAESVRPTYWTGVDLIAGSPSIFNCEFYLPIRSMNAQNEGKQFNFLEVLSKSLNMGLKDEYDYIIIDTPPALSYSTMNAYWAADAILMPIVPEGLGLQSSVQFWDLFSELAGVAQGFTATPKEYAWLGVIPSRVEGHKTSVQEMMKWIRMFYGQYVMASEIPQTDAVRTGGSELNTVYDISKYTGSAQTYARARYAFDNAINEIDTMTRTKFWGEKTGVNL